MKLFCCCSSQDKLPGSLSPDSYNANPEAIRLYCIADKLENSKKKNQEARITECYRQAAELGLRDAQRRMGLRLVYEDKEEAKTWFQRAADQDDPISKEYMNMFNALGPNESVPTSAMVEPNFVTFMRPPPGVFGSSEQELI